MSPSQGLFLYESPLSSLGTVSVAYPALCARTYPPITNHAPRWCFDDASSKGLNGHLAKSKITGSVVAYKRKTKLIQIQKGIDDG